MTMSTIPNTLPSIGLLAELDDSVRQTLSGAGRFEEVAAGTSLAVQGEPHHALSVILSGKATVSSHMGGAVVQLAVLQTGDTVGEMNIIDPQNASADVVMTTAGQVWTINEPDFQNIVQSDPHSAISIVHWLSRQLCRRIRRNTDRLLRDEEKNRQKFQDMDY